MPDETGICDDGDDGEDVQHQRALGGCHLIVLGRAISMIM